MSDLATYSGHERLPDGRDVHIRSLRPDDRDSMVVALGRTSAASFYRRFFGPRRELTPREIDFFVNVDFVEHVALVAVMEHDGRPTIVGGGRYVVVEPGTAEVAFAVVDVNQGKGLGSALIRHVIAVARSAGLRKLIADVLPDNASMLKVFENAGVPFSRTCGPGGIVHVTLSLT